MVVVVVMLMMVVCGIVHLIGDLRLGGDLRLTGDLSSGGRGGLIYQIIQEFSVDQGYVMSNDKLFRGKTGEKQLIDTHLISQPAHSRGFSTTGPFRGRLWSGDRSGSCHESFVNGKGGF